MTKQHSKLWIWQQECHNGGICSKCGRTVGWLTVDHIIPISFVFCLDNGKDIANNDEENFQKLCQPCNQMKKNNFDFTDPRTIALLKKYLAPYFANQKSDS